jgi:hypothetical protein
MSRGARALAACLLLPLAASAAPTRVLLVTAHCPEAEMARLTGLLATELRRGGAHEVLWTPEPPASSREEARLEVTCTAPALEAAHLAALPPDGGSRLERTVSLLDVPEAERPRGLSLALAELLHASAFSRPPVEPAPERNTAAAGGARLRQFFGPGTRLVGAEAVLGWRALRLGAGVVSGTARTSLGRVDVRLVSGSAGLALLRVEGGRLGAEAGLRLEVGEARAVGVVAAGAQEATWRTASRLHLAPGVFGGARLRLAGPAWLQVAVEAGHAWGLVAAVERESVASTAGPWVGGSAALRLAW